jgi:hypothetical protein
MTHFFIPMATNQLTNQPSMYPLAVGIHNKPKYLTLDIIDIFPHDSLQTFDEQ